MAKLELTRRMREMLNQAPKSWDDLSVGCTNLTLVALERRGRVETRLKPTTPGHYTAFGWHEWQWRRTP